MIRNKMTNKLLKVLQWRCKPKVEENAEEAQQKLEKKWKPEKIRRKWNGLYSAGPSSLLTLNLKSNKHNHKWW